MGEITLYVNGAACKVNVDDHWLLADVLREKLGLTGTHLGCEHGVCGACSVLVDGEVVRACLMLAVQADGREITTVEGLGDPDHLSLVQEAFMQQHGLQCGFCTPGFIVAATHLLNRNPHPTRQEVREALSGNICRCTGYQQIVDAVMWVADAREKDASTAS